MRHAFCAIARSDTDRGVMDAEEGRQHFPWIGLRYRVVQFDVMCFCWLHVSHTFHLVTLA